MVTDYRCEPMGDKVLDLFGKQGAQYHNGDGDAGGTERHAFVQ